MNRLVARVLSLLHVRGGSAQEPSALLAEFRAARQKRDVRLMAATGAVPLGPSDLLELLVFLTEDPNQEVTRVARATLLGYPAEDAQAAAASRDTAVSVLIWLLTNRKEPEIRAAVLQNQTLPDAAVELVAASLPQALAELVVINQTRLLRRTSLLAAIESNPNLTAHQRRRLRELREVFHAVPPATEMKKIHYLCSWCGRLVEATTEEMLERLRPYESRSGRAMAMFVCEDCQKKAKKPGVKTKS